MIRRYARDTLGPWRPPIGRDVERQKDPFVERDLDRQHIEFGVVVDANEARDKFLI